MSTTDECMVWPVDYIMCEMPAKYPAEDSPERFKFEAMAIQLLRAWTGGVYGVVCAYSQPCLDSCPIGWSTFWGHYPIRRVGGGGGCGCDTCHTLPPLSVVALPGPVHEVTSVTVGGEEFSGWVLDGDRLVRTDGEDWPTNGEVDWRVDYMRGRTVPVGGEVSAGLLAVEMWKAACGDSDCQLPQRVQTVTRQGVTVAMLDNFDGIDKGHTGIWLVDAWVSSVTKPPTRSIVRSPDYRGYRR